MTHRLPLALMLALVACHPQNDRPATAQPGDVAAIIAGDTSGTAPDTGVNYIGVRFAARHGSAPGLAWIVPPHRLLALGRHVTAVTFGSAGVDHWTFLAALDSTQAQEERRKYHVSCEERTGLYEYTGAGAPVEYGVRVMLIDSLHGEARAGLVSLPVDPDWAIGPVHRDTAFAVAPGEEFYSFHAAYDTSAEADQEMDTHGVKYLVLRGVLLHQADGKVLAAYVNDVPAVECDGCGTPTIADRFETVFAVLQVFKVPGFPHPVLLLDTGTIEGGAVSFATFDEKGVYREYRSYEYVMSC